MNSRYTDSNTIALEEDRAMAADGLRRALKRRARHCIHGTLLITNRLVHPV